LRTDDIDDTDDDDVIFDDDEFDEELDPNDDVFFFIFNFLRFGLAVTKVVVIIGPLFMRFFWEFL
jgi:hypothetical protein